MGLAHGREIFMVDAVFVATHFPARVVWGPNPTNELFPRNAQNHAHFSKSKCVWPAERKGTKSEINICRDKWSEVNTTVFFVNFNEKYYYDAFLTSDDYQANLKKIFFIVFFYFNLFIIFNSI